MHLRVLTYLGVFIAAVALGGSVLVLPAYKAYKSDLENQGLVDRAEAEAKAANILGPALRNNPEYLEYLRAKKK